VDTRIQGLSALLTYMSPSANSIADPGISGDSSSGPFGTVDPLNDFFRASYGLDAAGSSILGSDDSFASLIQAALAKTDVAGTAGSTLSTSRSSYNGISGAPVQGPVTSDFGKRNVPGISSNHTGIDYGVPEGTPVHSTGAGTVKVAGWQSGYGNVVYIQHDDGKLETIYGHNSKLTVQVGDRVSKGQVIAYSGNTGQSTGPHVHYEVRLGGKPTDPKPYIDATASAPISSADVLPISLNVSPSGGSVKEIIQAAAKRYGVDPTLVDAVVRAESGYNAKAISPAGAKGLMQLMPATAKSLGVSDAFDPAQNVDGGVQYLKAMLDKYDGDASLALAAYNAGPVAVDQYGGIPPYKETQNYVARVLNYRRQYGGAMIA
jgi:hypothetical protein